MANNKKRRSPNKKRGKKTSRPRPTRRTSPTLGRTIATGVKSLLSYIPGAGSVLSPIADFAFKAFGLIQTEVGTPLLNDEPSHLFSLVSHIQLTLLTIISGSEIAMQNSANRSIRLAFDEGRLIHMTITVAPNNAMEKRGGNLFIGFNPYFNEDNSSVPKYAIVPNEQSIHRMYRSASGTGSRSLSLSFRPTMFDGVAFQYHAITKSFGELAIRWEKPNRAVYTEITPDEFSVEVRISGKVELRSRTAFETGGSEGTYVFDKFVVDNLASTAAILQSPSGKTHIVQSNDKYSCKASTDKSHCLVSGRVIGTVGDYDYEMVE